MMYPRIFAALGLTLAALFTTVSGAAQAAETKVAVVRFDDAVRASPQYKAADKKMSDEFTKRKNDLEAQGKQFDEDVKKFNRDRDIMSPDARTKTEKDLSVRQVDLNQATRKFQEDAASRQRDLTNEVVGKVRDAIVAVAKEKSYDVVIQDPIYSSSAIDITDEVLKRLNAAPAGGK